ncbi:uncharacterized protein LOC118344779 [Juglans regia]|uniref:Uncharacterized protein LOC118344779 n=1 Tax=Juglans regia TaxID=51240 RepID=A0A6P9E1V3_JUGRE|nr:uncharacterized protein LOC118344779 [Juglans regia]
MEESQEVLSQRLSLSEQEKEEIIVEEVLLEETKQRGEHSLLVSLLMDKHYNHEVFKQNLRRIWRPVKKIWFKELGSKLLLVEFEDQREKARVQREGPWPFDRNLVLMQNFEGDILANKIKIVKVVFWIRLYELPLGAMNEKVVRMIGDCIGTVEEINIEKDEVAWGQFIRMRVSLDVTKPLMCGKCINLSAHGVCWVRFTYERLRTLGLCKMPAGPHNPHNPIGLNPLMSG